MMLFDGIAAEITQSSMVQDGGRGRKRQWQCCKYKKKSKTKKKKRLVDVNEWCWLLAIQWG
jgi:hypothetical protein